MEPRVGLVTRVLAGAGAVTLAAFMGFILPQGLLIAGYPYSAATMVLTALPLIAFLGVLALAPGMLRRPLARFTRVDLSDGGHVGALVLMAVVLYFVFGFGALSNGMFAWENDVIKGREPGGTVSSENLLENLALNLVLLTVPPLVYVSFVGGMGPVAAARALGLRSEGAPRAILLGAALAVGFIMAIALATFAAQQAGVELDQNDRALAIAKALTPLGILAVATISSVSEEVFFRGFLQPRIGLLAQAFLFAISHLSYANVLQVVVTFALGLAFGLLYRRTGNLWAPIAAHFAFNFIMLVVAVYGPEAAGGS